MDAAAPCRRLEGAAVVRALLARHEADRRAFSSHGIRPKLVLMRVGEHPAALSYVQALRRQQEAWQVGVEVDALPETTGPAGVRRRLRHWAKQEAVHGVVLTGPLPHPLQGDHLEDALPPAKDVAGAHPASQARFLEGHASFAPVPVAALLAIVDAAPAVAAACRAVVVARPAALPILLSAALHRRGHRVSIVPPDSAGLEDARRADLLVLLDGEREGLQARDVKRRAIVIDFGVHVAEDGSLVGHADQGSVETRAAAITPVPGGVGPVLAGALLSNLTKAARGGDPPAGRDVLPLFGGRA